jgi:dUTP pyrophosphatase
VSGAVLKVRPLHDGVPLPERATAGSACFDLRAYLPGVTRSVGVGLPVMIPTGLSFEVPAGHVMLVFSRSGHGFRDAVRLSNCVGVIDSDYRGEVMVKLHQDQSLNAPMMVVDGDRIAQAMVVALPDVELKLADDLSATDRGAGGFGSTGTA